MRKRLPGEVLGRRVQCVGRLTKFRRFSLKQLCFVCISMSVSQSPTQHMSKGKKRSHEETSIHPPRPSKKAKTHSAVHNSAASSSSTPFVKPAKGKGKGRETDGGFRDVKASLVVSIPPVFAKNLRLGVEEMLDSMVMRCVGTSYLYLSYIYQFRYIPALEGVVLSHSDLTFLNGPATILGDSPFAKCKVGFNATVWCPQAGMKLSTQFSQSVLSIAFPNMI